MNFVNLIQSKRQEKSNFNSEDKKGDRPNKVFDKKSAETFSFFLFGGITAGVLGLITLTNWLIDPLWYRSGNQITGRNFAFNERISKTNQFANENLAKYDCLILGSSRVIALNSPELKKNSCFNYSFKGGWAEDFISVSNYAKQQGLNPDIIYVGVDEFNFVKMTENTLKEQDFSTNRTISPIHAYVSSNVFLFSLMTLAGVSQDKFNYYDSNFNTREFADAPRLTPAFFPPADAQECDLTKVDLYREIKNIFPEAKIVGYVPPRSSWSVVNETYNRGIMNCVLDGFYKVSTIYDEMHDFSVPSVMTMDPSNTYDGSHFTVEANDQIAAMLEGRAVSIGIQVDGLTPNAYHTAYMEALKNFMRREHAEALIQE